jgi:hypothetical protein
LFSRSVIGAALVDPTIDLPPLVEEGRDWLLGGMRLRAKNGQ